MKNYVLTAISLANKYLPPKKLAHSMRVAEYALNDYDFYKYPRVEDDEIFVVALLHDVVEDTECTFEEIKECGIPDYLVGYLDYLTNRKDENYIEYIQRCASGPAMPVIVKRADMKDHFTQEDSLTDKLINKYLPHIKEFL